MKKTILLGIGIIGLILSLTACSNTKYKGDFSLKVQDFNYTNQDNQQVSLEDLKGKFWVADMFFTSCTTVCPPMTRNMAMLQQRLKKENMDVNLVSFSADPTVDTPEKLKEFANKYQADFSNWDFLTGYSQNEIKKFSVDSFKALIQKPKGTDQVIHSSSIYLVSPDGYAIKKYKGTRAASIDQIIKDLKGYLK